MGRLAFDNDVISSWVTSVLTLALKPAPSLLPLRMSKDEYCYATYRGGTTCLCTSMIKLLVCCTKCDTHEAHNTLSTIDHILSPQHPLPHFSNSSVLEEERTSQTTHTNFECVLQSPSLSATSATSTDKQIKVNSPRMRSLTATRHVWSESFPLSP